MTLSDAELAELLRTVNQNQTAVLKVAADMEKLNADILGEIKKGVDSVSKSVGKGLFDAVGKVGNFLLGGGSGGGLNIGKLFENVLREFARGSEKLFAEVVAAVAEVLKGAAELLKKLVEFAGALASVAITMVRELLKGVEESLRKLVTMLIGTIKLPDSIAEPFELLLATSKLSSISDALHNAHSSVAQRFDIVSNSFAQIASRSADDPLSALVVAAFDATKTTITSGKLTLERLAELSLTLPLRLLGSIYKAITEGRSTLNFVAPPRLLPAKGLHHWAHVGPWKFPGDPKLVQLERDFRASLVVAARRARAASPRSTDIFGELSREVAAETMSFIVAPTAALQQHAREASTFARQASASVEYAAGAIVRGVWVFGVQNEAIAETIAKLGASAVEAAVSAAEDAVASTCVIYETYKGEDADPVWRNDYRARHVVSWTTGVGGVAREAVVLARSPQWTRSLLDALEDKHTGRLIRDVLAWNLLGEFEGEPLPLQFAHTQASLSSGTLLLTCSLKYAGALLPRPPVVTAYVGRARYTLSPTHRATGKYELSTTAPWLYDGAEVRFSSHGQHQRVAVKVA